MEQVSLGIGEGRAEGARKPLLEKEEERGGKEVCGCEDGE